MTARRARARRALALVASTLAYLVAALLAVDWGLAYAAASLPRLARARLARWLSTLRETGR